MPADLEKYREQQMELELLIPPPIPLDDIIRFSDYLIVSNMKKMQKLTASELDPEDRVKVQNSLVATGKFFEMKRQIEQSPRIGQKLVFDKEVTIEPE